MFSFCQNHFNKHEQVSETSSLRKLDDFDERSDAHFRLAFSTTLQLANHQ